MLHQAKTIIEFLTILYSLYEMGRKHWQRRQQRPDRQAQYA